MSYVQSYTLAVCFWQHIQGLLSRIASAGIDVKKRYDILKILFGQTEKMVNNTKCN